MSGLRQPATPEAVTENASFPFGAVRRGRILRILGDESVEVALKDGRTVRARVAVPPGTAIVPGAEGLTVRDEDGDSYLTVVLRPAAGGDPCIRGADGSSARLIRDAGGEEVIELLDRSGCLIASHHTARNLTRVVSLPGDIEIAAPAGRLRLSAGQELELESPRISLRARETAVATGSMEVDVDVAQVTADRARLVARRLDLLAEHAVSRLHSLYQSVAGLFHSRAGRTKITSEEAFDLHGGRVFLRSSKEVRVLGSKIHLG